MEEVKKGEYPFFTFSDVEVKQAESGEYVLVGNYIKETQYTVHTTVQNGELRASPSNVPTAPYSRFIIFLKNHRMVLVRNESSSPDIRSFQATVRSVLNRFIREKNKEEDRNNDNRFPYALVNIVDIPLKEDIETLLKEVEKINWISLRFFPLNNDINPLPLAVAFKDEMRSLGSKTANAKFNSPDSKAAVKQMLENTAGLAITTMKITDSDGEVKNIKQQSFSSNKKITFNRDIAATDDEYLISQAKKYDIINKTSEANQSLYEKFIEFIKKTIK